MNSSYVEEDPNGRDDCCYLCIPWRDAQNVLGDLVEAGVEGSRQTPGTLCCEVSALDVVANPNVFTRVISATEFWWHEFSFIES